MAVLDPANTTIGDLVNAALKLATVIGVGQTADAEDSNDTWSLCQMMLEGWQRRRWLVFALTTLSVVSTGAQSYTLGPGALLDTGAGSFRPDKIESAFVRQLNITGPNLVDFPPLEILQSKEDYNGVSLKSLVSFPQYVFYDPQWPTGLVYPWPLPQANIYGLYVTVKTPMQYKFATLSTKIALPYEYYEAILYNLALRVRMQYGISNPPGDSLNGLAKNALNSLRLGNTAIKRLQMPAGVANRGKGYNIFSDRFS